MRRLLLPLSIILSALLLVVVLAGTASAGTNRVLFTGQQIVTSDHQPSDRDFAAGLWAWTYHTFDHTVVLAQDASLNYLDGEMVQHAAEVLVAPPLGAGAFAVGHGTYTLVTAYGNWEGTIVVKVDLILGVTTFTAQGRGVSGEVDGWLVKWTGEYWWSSGSIPISGYVIK
jgi:hypothetical protein